MLVVIQMGSQLGLQCALHDGLGEQLQNPVLSDQTFRFLVIGVKNINQVRLCNCAFGYPCRRQWPINDRLVTVGMPIAGHPPRRSRRAQFTHRAPALGIWRRSGLPDKDEGREVRVAIRCKSFSSSTMLCGLSDYGALAHVARGRPHGVGRMSLREYS